MKGNEMGRRPAAFTSFELEAEAEAAEAAAAAVSRKAATVNSGGGLISAAAEKRTLLQSPIVLPIVLVGMDCQDRPGLAPLLRAATRMERGAPPLPPACPLTRLSPPHVCVRLPPSTDPKKASQSAGRKCAINHVEKRGPASFVEVDADAAMDRCDAHSICMRTVQYCTTQYWLAHKKMQQLYLFHHHRRNVFMWRHHVSFLGGEQKRGVKVFCGLRKRLSIHSST